MNQGACTKCMDGREHPWHDNGDINLEWDLPERQAPPTHLDEGASNDTGPVMSDVAGVPQPVMCPVSDERKDENVSEHGLSVEDVPKPVEYYGGRTWRQVADEIAAALGKEPLSDDELDAALWNYTAYGFAGPEYVGWQLAAFIGDPEGTIARVDAQFDALAVEV